MKNIHYYTSKKYSKIFLAVLTSVVLLTIIIDFVELTRRLSGKSANLLDIIKLTFLKQPPLILDVMPFVILISAILFLSRLSNNSEITIFKSSGVSLKTIFKAPLMIIIVISLIEILVLNHFAAYTELTYKNTMNSILSGSKLTNPGNDNKELWFKQNQLDNPYIFRSKKVRLKDKSILLDEITLIFLDKKENNSKEASTKVDRALDKSDGINRLTENKFLYAKTAEIRNNKLIMTDVSIIKQKNKYTSVGDEVTKLDIFVTDTSISREFIKSKIESNIKNRGVESVWNVLSSLKLLKKMGFSVSKQIALLNFTIFKPVFYICLFLLAGIFCIYPPRHQKKILYIISSVVIGFVSYFILNIFYTLAAASKLSILFGIWLPHILLLLLVLYLLIKKEEGHFI